MQTNLKMDRKLMNLSCPFTWEMESVIQSQDKLLETTDDRLEMVVDVQDVFPEFVLIYHLMLAYESVKKNDIPSAMQSMNEADQILADIIEKAAMKNVENALQHIFVATKCHILRTSGQLTEINELIKKICDVKNMNQSELAMLNGCQCLAWSLYYVTDNSKAINHAKTASELDPRNGKWQFLLGKNYRRLRRNHGSLSQQPTNDETSAYEKAYRLSENVLFGVELAQSYWESQERVLATETYKKVHALQPTSCTVKLRLALGFIRTGQRELANSCLQYVGEKMPDSVMYTHYMGIYQAKLCKNSEAALPYYKSSIEKLNFGAEWQYMECKKRVEPDWDPLPYMLGLLKKYEKSSDHIIQDVNIQIGLYHLLKINDIPSACQYLTVAINIKPDAKALKTYYPLFSPSVRINVYRSLKKEVESALWKGGRRYNNTDFVMLKKTLQLCRANFQG